MIGERIRANLYHLILIQDLKKIVTDPDPDRTLTRIRIRILAKKDSVS